MAATHSPNQNYLLAALPPRDFEILAAHLELVPMPLGEFLYEPGTQLQYAYFPTTAIVSLHYVMASGASAETAGVGHEGVVGISLFMGGDTTPSSAVVQTAGHAYRLDKSLLMQEFNRAGILQKLLLRYTQALITQMSQTAACNRHHSVEQQLCRWLLLCDAKALPKPPGNCSMPVLLAIAVATLPCLIVLVLRPGPANVTPWSRKNWIVCCLTCSIVRIHPQAISETMHCP
jgi:CRP-like cAMP-binding protein